MDAAPHVALVCVFVKLRCPVTLHGLTLRRTQGFYLPEKAKCKCLHVTATANNGLKTDVEAASVFGFINDVNGDSAAAVNANGNSHTVLAPILKPVPRGKSSVEFEVAVFVCSRARSTPGRLS